MTNNPSTPQPSPEHFAWAVTWEVQSWGGKWKAADQLFGRTEKSQADKCVADLLGSKVARNVYGPIALYEAAQLPATPKAEPAGLDQLLGDTADTIHDDYLEAAHCDTGEESQWRERAYKKSIGLIKRKLASAEAKGRLRGLREANKLGNFLTGETIRRMDATAPEGEPTGPEGEST